MDQGESLAPIGRWEKSIRSLAARGFARALDPHNYVITADGRVATKAHDQKIYGGMIAQHNQIVSGRQEFVDAGNAAAEKLAAAVRIAAKITGDDLDRAFEETVVAVKTRARELLT